MEQQATHIVYKQSKELDPNLVHKRVRIVHDEGWGYVKCELMDEVNYTTTKGASITYKKGWKFVVSSYDLIEVDKV
jgi:hypothetical protein